jgi:ethanolamine phosphate transferase 2 subunit G
MLPKQREMDGIVKQIYEALESEEHLESTVFVICGDHGMNDAGNHGASSPGETSPALVFMSPKFMTIRGRQQAPLPEVEDFQYYATIEQSDLAPTLGALLGFPIPKNNLGAFIPDFLPFWSNRTFKCSTQSCMAAVTKYMQENDQDQILIRNARQILGIVTEAFGARLFDPQVAPDFCSKPGSDVEELACEWQNLLKSAKLATEKNELNSRWTGSMIAVRSFDALLNSKS